MWSYSELLAKKISNQIVEIEFNKLRKRLGRKEIEIELDDAAKNLLVEKGFQPEMGARPLKRIIQQSIEDTLAEKLLLHPSQKKKYLISTKDKEIPFEEAVK